MAHRFAIRNAFIRNAICNSYSRANHLRLSLASRFMVRMPPPSSAGNSVVRGVTPPVQGAAAGPVGRPASVIPAPEVVMSAAPRISRFSLGLVVLACGAGSARPAAAKSPTMGSPMSVATSMSRVFVTDGDGDRIHVFTPGGEPLMEWGASGSGPGELRGHAWYAVGPDGSLGVDDLFNPL